MLPEYELPALAFASVAVSLGATPFTVSVNVFSVEPAELVRVNLTVYFPASVGVPVIVAVAPVETCENFRVLGSPVTVHFIFADPFAESLSVYFLSVVAAVSEFVDSVGFCTTVRGTFKVAFPAAFLAVTVIVNFPAFVGVPERIPELDIFIPEGWPDIDHVIGVVPSEAVN